jgi:hypothetical protein
VRKELQGLDRKKWASAILEGLQVVDRVHRSSSLDAPPSLTLPSLLSYLQARASSPQRLSHPHIHVTYTYDIRIIYFLFTCNISIPPIPLPPSPLSPHPPLPMPHRSPPSPPRLPTAWWTFYPSCAPACPPAAPRRTPPRLRRRTT